MEMRTRYPAEVGLLGEKQMQPNRPLGCFQKQFHEIPNAAATK